MEGKTQASGFGRWRRSRRRWWSRESVKSGARSQLAASVLILTDYCSNFSFFFSFFFLNVGIIGQKHKKVRRDKIFFFFNMYIQHLLSQIKHLLHYQCVGVDWLKKKKRKKQEKNQTKTKEQDVNQCLSFLWIISGTRCKQFSQGRISG